MTNRKQLIMTWMPAGNKKKRKWFLQLNSSGKQQDSIMIIQVIAVLFISLFGLLLKKQVDVVMLGFQFSGNGLYFSAINANRIQRNGAPNPYNE